MTNKEFLRTFNIKPEMSATTEQSWTQAEMIREASMGETAMFGPSDPRGRTAASYHWTFDPKTDLTRFEGLSDAEWAEWFDDEVQMHAEEGRDRMYADMDREIEYPVVAVEYQGKLHLWDGAHRVGSSHKYGRTTIPAIIGRLIA